MTTHLTQHIETGGRSLIARRAGPVRAVAIAVAFALAGVSAPGAEAAAPIAPQPAVATQTAPDALVQLVRQHKRRVTRRHAHRRAPAWNRGARHRSAHRRMAPAPRGTPLCTVQRHRNAHGRIVQTRNCAPRRGAHKIAPRTHHKIPHKAQRRGHRR